MWLYKYYLLLIYKKNLASSSLIVFCNVMFWNALKLDKRQFICLKSSVADSVPFFYPDLYPWIRLWTFGSGLGTAWKLILSSYPVYYEKLADKKLFSKHLSDDMAVDEIIFAFKMIDTFFVITFFFFVRYQTIIHPFTPRPGVKTTLYTILALDLVALAVTAP